ncbi:MAG: single-stranded DNA-binding protein [Deltaproteobacteria bacterium]|nr:single-stranded DNA-binding protein [Deltaproteobacteria bacterium]
MAGVNKVFLLGHLGRDPEIRYTKNGTAVTTFSMATSEKNKDGDELTEWHNIVTWARLAEICAEYLSKGSQVFIEGSMKLKEWEGRDGNKRSRTEIHARSMQMCGSRSKDSGGGTRQSQGGGQGNEQSGGGTNRYKDEIPF